MPEDSLQLELPKLSPDQFPEFFASLWRSDEHGESRAAFDWQRELVTQIERTHVWPGLIDLPTGTGKTSLLEIAVFLQALDAERDPAERWMPRRVLLVVDRRVVVDQADDRGRRIAEKLTVARTGDGVIFDVATRLRHLFAGGDDDPPLITSVLRGGIVRDESWALRPDVPALISSTVDQVGSRVLFRGYGISAAMQPIHAGLLANDCLILLDEVHLARPFAQTLAWVDEYRGRAARRCTIGEGRWHVVEMSATPILDKTAVRFPSTPLDPGSDTVLRRRLTASKPARLEPVQVPADRDKADQRFAAECMKEVRVLLARSGATAIGVIVNRVDAARLIAQRLARSQGGSAAAFDVCLLTGRMRPVDRDVLLKQYRGRLDTGRDRDAALPPLVVVATQCIEAGADFDLDGIVTECASLDALRQRFGRVDRDGRRSESDSEIESVILARSTLIDDGAEPDPVYGQALARTWAWLQSASTVDPGTSGSRRLDFGIRALPEPSDDELAMLVPPLLDAPVLLPGHLDAWVQTSPAPAVQPDVGFWLHGLQDPKAEVQVVWRQDLTEALLLASDGLETQRVLDHAAIERVRSCPPTSTEALAVPVAAARRWLRGQTPAELTDVEGARVDEYLDHQRSVDHTERRAIRWAGSETDVVPPGEIKPGDMLVVPSDYGGLDLGSWAPETSDSVRDVAYEAIRDQRWLAVLRLLPELWPKDIAFPDIDAYHEASTTERRALLTGWLRVASDDLQGHPEHEPADRDGGRYRGGELRGMIDDVLAVRPDRLSVQELGRVDLPRGGKAGPGLVITAPLDRSRRRNRGRRAALQRQQSTTETSLPLEVEGEPDGPSFTGRLGVTLPNHLAGVSQWTREFAKHVGLRPELVADLGVAASLHDLGKADARFQAWLAGGPIAPAESSKLLAKSSTPSYDRATRESTRQISGYPSGARHELTSVAMVTAADRGLASANDPELVLHLIAAHHGGCRPFAPIVHDPMPVEVVYDADGTRWSASSAHRLERIDSGIAERFWRLVERYGWFGLAWLEAILRLADHRQSELEEHEGKRQR